jgi:hypothetical protein
MSELPFDIPQNNQELKTLFLETRQKFVSLWQGLSHEALTCRPGPKPDWSVKDTIAHIYWWEIFAISRIVVLDARQEVKFLDDYNWVNEKVFSMYQDMPLETVLALFAANQAQIESLMDAFSFEEWTDETRPNFQGESFMRLIGANTFGHYFEHMDDLQAYREKNL